MKDFLKYMLASMAGFLLFSVIMGVIGFISLVGMIVSSSQSEPVNDNSVFVINLSGSLQERANHDVFSMITGNGTESTGLDEMLSAIKKAKESDKVKGIYIEAGMFSPDSYASMQAIRKALLDFKKSGKWIMAYADTYTQSTYYLASVADKVYLNPSGMIEWSGIASQMMFYKDAMAKFGVKMQVAKVGTYKSAVEPYTSDKMSDANREQVSAYIGGIWKNVCADVAASRNLTVAQLNQYADSMVTFADQKDYVKMKLVDGLLYADQLKAEVKKMMKLEEDDDYHTVGLSAVASLPDTDDSGDEIAVYYAYGDIVDKAPSGVATGEYIDGQKVNEDLRKLADDDDVKAVVIRVNSGGGSAYASEQIWRAVQLLKAKKPVVVSMGGMAASGGYYMSCSANWIVAEPTTLTGSIGIFGMFPDFSGLLTEKLGVKFDGVSTNKFSAFGTMARPFNEQEMAYLTAYISRGYSLFRKRVADGRGMSVDAVEKIAQGHVWTGEDALKVKLVDQLGGIDEAVAKAAQLAKTEEYHTVAYPADSDYMAQLLGALKGSSYIDGQMREALGSAYPLFTLLKNMDKQSAIQARMPYYIIVR